MEKLKQTFKIFNYRPFVLVLISLIAGILFKAFLSTSVAIVVVVSIIAVGLITIYSVLHKTFKYAIVFMALFLVGITLYSIRMDRVDNKPVSLVEQEVTAEIVSVKNYDTYLSILVKDITTQDKKLDFNAQVYYSNSNDTYKVLEEGQVIKFVVQSENFDIEYIKEDGVHNSYYIKNDIGAILRTKEVSITGHNNTIRLSILNRIRKNLNLGLSNQNAEMIYSAMFGDKINLDGELYNAYKISGLAHLLAISGLHVGLVTAILYWILKKCRVKNWWKVLIIATFLFCYAYLCNFSYSMVRASVMSLVLVMAPALFREYDALSSICLAGVVVLFIDPLALFDVGAMLSFGCVFGIASLFKPIKHLLSYTKLPTVAIDSVSISISTLIGVWAVMAYYFGDLPIISIVSNLLILPLFSILFTICFIIAMLSFMMPAICYLLAMINPLLEFTNWLVINLAYIAKGLVMPAVDYMTIILNVVLIAFMGQYNIKSNPTKALLISCIMLALSVQILSVSKISRRV